MATYRPLYPDKQSGDQGVLHDVTTQPTQVDWPPVESTPVVAMYSEKGGVGKTGTTAGMAAVAGAAGLRVLCIDLDPRATLTNELGVLVHSDHDPDRATREEDERGVDLHVVELSLNDILASSDDPIGLAEDVVCAAGDDWPDTVHLLPAERLLQNRESDPQPGLDMRLRLALDGVVDTYDLAIVDLPPRAGGWLAAVGIAAATHVIMPATLDEDGLDGVREAQTTLRLRRRGVGLPPVTPVGVVRTLVSGQRTGIAEDYDARLHKLFVENPQMPLLDRVVVPQAVVRRDARSYSTPITSSGEAAAQRLQWAYAQLVNAVPRATQNA